MSMCMYIMSYVLTTLEIHICTIYALNFARLKPKVFKGLPQAAPILFSFRLPVCYARPIYMWQSRVENERYSVPDFSRKWRLNVVLNF